MLASRPGMPTLLYCDVDGVDRTYELGPQPAIIGRAADCAIRSDDPRMSRQHARVVFRGGGYAIVDNGSNPIAVNGQPVREPFRSVRPPVPVLVDLTVLFPREPHRNGRYHPHGLQMHKVVEGRLSCWGICEQGDWWGLVTYEIAYGSRRREVTHWVPAWILRRNNGGEERAH